MDRNQLSNEKCEPCSGNTPKLTFEEIGIYLSKLNKWSVNDNQEMIFKKFKFNNFKKSLEFTNKVGELAEKEGHHPDIWFGWGYARIKIFTHAINGLHESDFVLAAKIDKISSA